MAVQALTTKGDRSDAHVVEVERRFLVRPSPVIPKNGKRFRLSNLTPYPVVVEFLPGLNLEAGQSASVPIAPHAYEDIKLGENAEQPHTYRVRVNVNGAEYFAQGDSDPVIIIDPPTA